MKRAASTPPPMHGNEMRYNPATGRWVIYALSRRQRPRELIGSREGARTEPAYDELCPFCPGHEQDLPPILLEYGRGDSHRQIRVVRNKYPALTPEGDLKRVCQGMYMRMEGYGHHEVLIESPEHNRQIPVMTPEEVELIIEAYHRRYLKLIGVQKNLLVVIFRNYGRRAGASLMHPHSQIISTGVVPGHVREMEYRAQGYFDQWGSCMYCDMLAEELSAGVRIIHANRSFVSFIPYAAAQPFEIWIMPREHKAHFGDISAEEKTDLASSLHAMLRRIQERLNDPDYNYVIHSSAKYRSDEPQAHWFLQIGPKLTTRAGFEIGSGMSINTSLPEDDAAFLMPDPLPEKGAGNASQE
ncbi:MAG: galactose-1-phosphate uridylyltransferase [Desulfomonilia bacterium]|jgi:UDPglucose--hexose-1-phosphate uridylyltransferase|nr:galactose-1-phosphate uridylyltransferase [Deltaproteobacteria bacterium]HRS55485.1 galactose-1-phosphate uridylyltransferase [Desulfomonilia bacterium]HRV35102.1 galactose-1-phosphate uridylyltransferase [Desulfomonilia bacterium]